MLRTYAIRVSFLLLFALLVRDAVAQGAEPIRHTLRFPDARNHYVHVESVFPTGGAAEIEVFMAVWTPGSYLVREYARNIDRVEASDAAGNALAATKSRKNRWRVKTNGAAAVTLRYPVYCREMSVRTNFVEHAFAMLQGAATYLSLVGENQRPHVVTVELPAHWSRAVSALPDAPGGVPNRFYAEDYDTLVDSPLIAGNPDVFAFEVRGKKHYLVNTPASDLWDGPKSVEAAKRIVEHYAQMWGELPYEKYVFFNMLVEAGGGLEHKNSTVLMTSAYTTRNDSSFLGSASLNPPRSGWVGLVSHEYFHLWNVKRLRPKALGPFDYENENYTESLWICEGITSYYDDLALHRAGLIDRNHYLALLSGAIAGLQSRPGRLVQAAAESSFDAWIKGYRPDENSPNTGISYYTKGSVMGFLLDARVRKATANAKSLDDVMRLAYQRYAGPVGFTPEEFRDCVREIAGPAVADWLRQAEYQLTDFDYTEELAHLGLRFRGAGRSSASRSGSGPVPGWLGAQTRVNGASVIVTGVQRGTPAYDAGLNVEDEILAIGNRRIGATLWPRVGEFYHAGETVEMLVARRGSLVKIPVTFGEQPRSSWQLEVMPDATEAQRAALEAWLSGR
jgi:predicted metalloprotease with PDZ domain